MKSQHKSLRELGLSSRKASLKWHSQLRRLLRAPSPSLHTAKALNHLLARLGLAARVLDLGSGTRRLGPRMINFEIGPFPNVDVIGDGATLPFKSSSLDAVICQAVLEHVPDPKIVVSEITRVLKPGGFVYAEIPFMQGHHADPYDFQRYTIHGIEYLFKDFLRRESGVCVGPSSTVAWILREYLSVIAGKGRARPVVSNLFGWITFWIKYFDLVLAGHSDSYLIASGFFYLGTKKE